MLSSSCALLFENNVGYCRQNRLYVNDFFDLLNEQKHNFLRSKYTFYQI